MKSPFTGDDVGEGLAFNGLSATAFDDPNLLGKWAATSLVLGEFRQDAYAVGGVELSERESVGVLCLARSKIWKPIAGKTDRFC